MLSTRYGLTCDDDDAGAALITTPLADKTVSMGKTRDEVHCPNPSCPISSRSDADTHNLGRKIDNNAQLEPRSLDKPGPY
jgi:hypothetical protein